MAITLSEITQKWGPIEWAQAYNGLTLSMIPDRSWGRSEDAIDIIRRLYMWEDECCVDDVFRRVAIAVAPRGLGPEVYEALCRGEFAFSTPIMMNATHEKKFMSAACFILPIEDSMDSIMDTAKIMSKIYSHAGGAGVNLTPLRPKGSPVKGTGGKAGGPVSFLHLFQGVGKAIFAGGRARKAAFMAALDIEHDDIVDFINAKKENSNLNEMNLSVRIRDMSIADSNPELWREIIECAWRCGDPGVIFTDNQDKAMPALLIDEQGSCGNNPCAEFCFPPGYRGAACNLGSVNLLAHVRVVGKKNFPFTGVLYDFDFGGIVKSSKLLHACLNNIIDITEYPTDAIKAQILDYRPVGVGVTGFARALIKIGIRYGHELSIKVAEKIMCAVQTGCDKSELNEPTDNVVNTTIAPTGTLSWVVGAEGSYGIEPLFALEATKKMKDPVTGEEKSVVICTPEAEGASSDVLVTANELSVEEHLKVAAAFQKHNDMSISKTVNLPNSATVKDVDKVFRLAHKLGLKGITVYRDGCLDEQVMYDAAPGKVFKTIKEGRSTAMSKVFAGAYGPDPNFSPKVPGYAKGCVHRIKIGGRALYVHIYKERGKITQVFLTYDKPGEHVAAFTSALGRVISIGLQHGVPAESFASTLREIYAADGSSFHRFPGQDKSRCIKSVPDAISAVLEIEGEANSGCNDKADEDESILHRSPPKKNCPCCGKKTLQKIAGCDTCTYPGCGYSSCG